jgi:hypothetical protein
MLMPNPAIALGETRRVLREGGRLAFAVWEAVIATRGSGCGPDPRRARPGAASRSGRAGMFALANKEELRALVEDARFSNVQIDDVPVKRLLRRRRYVRRANEMGGAFSRAWTSAPEDQREPMTAELRDAFEPYAVDGGYELPGLAICVLAR